MNEAILDFTKMEEGDKFIVFDPPLKVEIYKSESHEDVAFLDFDFGMNFKINYSNWITKKMPDDWIARTRRMIEFELFHAFHHTNIDPNYGVLNWALFGNLAHRVTCGQDCGDGVDFKDWEVWMYDNNFKIVVTDNPYNLKFT